MKKTLRYTNITVADGKTGTGMEKLFIVYFVVFLNF